MIMAGFLRISALLRRRHGLLYVFYSSKTRLETKKQDHARRLRLDRFVASHAGKPAADTVENRCELVEKN